MKVSSGLFFAILAVVEFQQEAISQTYSAKHIFTDDEIATCTRFRTPTLVRNPETGAIHLTTRCCGKNRCSGKASVDPITKEKTLRDNLKDCKVQVAPFVRDRTAADALSTVCKIWDETSKVVLDRVP